jgi:hypothetical protein
MNFFFFFRWRYSPLWSLACRTIPLHLSLSITNSLHLLTPNTWRSPSISSLHHFLGLPLRLVPSSSWVKNFWGILSSSILSRWPRQLILWPFIHFTIFSPLFNSSSSRFVLIFHSPSSSDPWTLDLKMGFKMEMVGSGPDSCSGQGHMMDGLL